MDRAKRTQGRAPLAPEVRLVLALIAILIGIGSADIAKNLGAPAAMIFMGVAGLALYVAIHYRR
jgi:hypothetical protein